MPPYVTTRQVSANKCPAAAKRVTICTLESLDASIQLQPCWPDIMKQANKTQQTFAPGASKIVVRVLQNASPETTSMIEASRFADSRCAAYGEEARENSRRAGVLLSSSLQLLADEPAMAQQLRQH